jgi:CO/xanthine dehydrogenase Mo-binding subunit
MMSRRDRDETALDPLVVEGQVLGGDIAGSGTGLLEEMRYDERRQLLMDYLLPAAGELPEITAEEVTTAGLSSGTACASVRFLAQMNLPASPQRGDA